MKLFTKIWKKIRAFISYFDVMPDIFRQLETQEAPVLIVMNNEDSFLVGKFINGYRKFFVYWIELELLDSLELSLSQNGETIEDPKTITVNVSHISYICPREDI